MMELITLSLIELFSWLGFFGIVKHNKIQSSLIDGTNFGFTIPVLDGELERRTLKSSYIQRKIASKTSKAIKYITNTKAFELAVLYYIQKQMNNSKEIRLRV